MKAIHLKSFFLAALFLLAGLISYGTHMTGGGITYRWLGTGNDYEITTTLYRDCFGVAAPASITLDITSVSCGQALTSTTVLSYQQEIIQLCSGMFSTCNGGTEVGIQKCVYIDSVTLPMACTDWVFSYTSCCRSASITTILNAGMTDLYIYAKLDNLTFGNNSSVQFANDPELLLYTGVTNRINNGAFDTDGDSISITLAPVNDGNVQYNPGYSYLEPIYSIPPMMVDSITGDISVTPVAVEVSLVVYKAEEFRNGQLIGSVIRDLLIYTVPTTNALPDIFSQPVYTACANSTLDLTLPVMDMDPADSTYLVTYSFNAPVLSYSLTHVQGQWDTLHLVFNPDTTMISPDPYLLSVNIRDNNCPRNGNQQFTYRIYVTNCGINVWPGDADANLTCDIYDVLPIGIAYGNTGPVRAGASLAWVAQPGTPWGVTFNSGLDYMHADCNGDGIVDASDTLAISQNFGLTHPLRLGNPDAQINSVAPMELVASVDSVTASDTFTIEVRLGNNQFPVDELYGVAFRLNFNPALINDTASHLDFVSSWLGTPGTDLLGFQKAAWSDGYIDVAAVRTDQLNAGGDSTIVVLSVVIIDNVSTRAVNHFSLSGIRGVKLSGEWVYFNAVDDSIVVNAFPVGIHNENNIAISLYPNPVQSHLTIQSSAKMNTVEIYNHVGEMISVMKASSSYKTQLNVSAVAKGVYHVRIKTDSGISDRLFVK